MKPATLAAIESELQARTGIDLGERGREALHDALVDLQRRLHADDGPTLDDVPPSAFIADLVSSVTINETYFWRTPAHFEALQQELLPRLAARRTTPVRVWSASCSTGPEAYSVAMAAAAAGILRSPGIQIEATDVDEDALALARQATYGAWAMRGTSPEMRTRWFTRRDDGALRPRDELRDVVTFGRHSLIDRRRQGQYDVILCRNTLIYFDHATRVRVVDNLREALRPGGTLFVAPAELQAGLFDAFEMVTFRSGAIAYRRPGSSNDGLRVDVATIPSQVDDDPSPVRTNGTAQGRRRTGPLATVEHPRRSRPRPLGVRPAVGNGAPDRAAPNRRPSSPMTEKVDEGLRLLEDDDTDAAVATLREVTVLAPDNADGHAALALALLRVGERTRAEVAARRAASLTELTPSPPRAGRIAALVLATLAVLEEDA